MGGLGGLRGVRLALRSPGRLTFDDIKAWVVIWINRQIDRARDAYLRRLNNRKD